MRNGQGTFTFADGEVWSGTWTNNDLNAPSYSLQAKSSSVDEGATANFELTVSNYKSGTSLSYSLLGIASSDISGGKLSGTTTIGTDGKSVFSIPIAEDKVTEGVETLSVTVGGTSASVQILDTSKQTGASAYTIVPSASSANEGATAKFTVSATGATAGTSLAYTLSGLNPEDIVGGEVNGSVVLNTLGNGTISIPIAADMATEGPEVMVVTVGGQIAAITINDTSKSG